MKKVLLLAGPALILTGSVLAQTSIKVPQIKDPSIRNQAVKVSRHGAIHNEQTNTSALGVNNMQQRAATVNTVGTTTYQLQSNYSVQNRIVANADNTISVAYTFSNTTSWADRGTGYVYYNGTAWSAAPTARIEPVRTGWPSLMVLGNGGEVVITHANATSPAGATVPNMAKRPTKGTGAWTSSSAALTTTAPFGNTWPRAINGGTDGNTIHMIVISNPTDGAASPADVFWKGQQGCMTYSRSQDGGATWDKLHEVPAEHDSTQYRGFTADTYAIDARGNVVAYVVGGPLNDLFLMKSTDNGDTWTKTNILNFPIPFFDDQITDITGDGIADTINTNDGTVCLLIDETNTVNVWFGNMRVINDDETDGLYSYFPGTASLSFWREGMSAPVVIAGAEDINGSGTLDITGWGTYQNSLVSFASAGIDENNTIHVTYSAIVEETDLGGGKSARNVYYFSTSDHGATWTTPIRVNPEDFNEQVWCSVARRAQSNCVKMIYESDSGPGHGTTSTNPDFGDNASVTAEEVYACLDPTVGVAEITNLSQMVSIFPNPANTQVTINTLNPMTRLELFNSAGMLVATFTPNTNNATIDVSGLSKGLYVINAYNGNNKLSTTLVKE